ncbi:hypothetical protein [Nitrosopumilus sp. b2]|uniref:hypothetical protein n=1 Tax=Nitrosopumilus sp. b2 TaxID=2109908 RepID=UPI0015F6E279|nr:hypothetical protein [Nitrosopumilus sp. b2]KAF6245894.1 hypothetical protein C6989_01850 [Nitrosopumilus sp. b2]
MKTQIISIFVVMSLIFVIPLANAQISLGEKAEQESVEVFISSNGNVEVKHVVKPSNLPVDLELINGTISNLSVTNEHGENLEFSTNDKNVVLIQPSIENSIVKYNISDVLYLKERVWTWDFRYLETTSFIFPEKVDFVFSNERPVFLGDKKGIACHGCQMLLEYSTDEFKSFEKIKWEDKEFIVAIISNSKVNEFVFDQPTKSITYDVSEKNRFVNTIIPLELLWGPYSVFLDDEKTFFHEYINNGTHVWVSVIPETSGEVTIIGTTVIPEFPIIAPLAIGFLMILVLPFMKKFNLR